jgi:UDP-glucose 4-epimerase
VTYAGHGRSFNLGGMEPWPLLDVARLCQEIAGAGGGVETVPWPEDRKMIDIGSIYVDHSRLTALTGWEPLVGLREGLERTIAFYKEHGEHYWR